MYINTNQLFKHGTRLILQIEFPDRLFVHRGEVVWTIQAPENLRGALRAAGGQPTRVNRLRRARLKRRLVQLSAR